jgi:hypothetical protein
MFPASHLRYIFSFQRPLMTTELRKTEKIIKQVLERYLRSHGWEVSVAWGATHGNDIEAKRGQIQWIIEVEGWEYAEDMAESFVLALGKIMQRMHDPDTKYSMAFLDIAPFHRLWSRLPRLVKSRTGITALFVDPEGRVTENTC